MLKEYFQMTKSYRIGLLQGKAYRILEHTLTAVLKEYNLSIPEWKLLGVLQETEKMRIVDLAKELDVDAPLVTALVNSLKDKKLIGRLADKNDKRVMYVVITDKSKSLIKESEKKVRSALKNSLNGLSLAELTTYIKVLQKIVNNASV